jgi:hypothetical protein
MVAASVFGLRRLEDRPGQRIQRIVRSLGEIHLADKIAARGVQHVDVIGGAVLSGRHVKQPSVRVDRQPIDTGIDSSVPDDRLVLNIQAIDLPNIHGVEISDIKLAGDGARRHAPDVADTGHRRNGLNQPVSGIDVIHRDRSAILCRLVHRVETPLNILSGKRRRNRRNDHACQCRQEAQRFSCHPGQPS